MPLLGLGFRVMELLFRVTVRVIRVGVMITPIKWGQVTVKVRSQHINWTEMNLNDLQQVDVVKRLVQWPLAKASRFDWLQRNQDAWCSVSSTEIYVFSSELGFQFSSLWFVCCEKNL